MLNATGKSARIYYGGDCQVPDNNTNLMPQPSLRFNANTKDVNDLEALTRALANNDNLSIVERGDIIGLYINYEREKFLDTEIADVSFSVEEQYNANLALSAIAEDGALQAAEEVFGKQHMALLLIEGVRQPTEGYPHLPPSISNVSFDEALDVVAKTFHGIVFYETCGPTSNYKVLFAGGFFWRP